MINDILDLDQINQGKITLAERPTSLEAYTASVRETIDPLMKAKDLTLKLDSSEAGCTHFTGNILQWKKKILKHTLKNKLNINCGSFRKIIFF